MAAKPLEDEFKAMTLLKGCITEEVSPVLFTCKVLADPYTSILGVIKNTGFLNTFFNSYSSQIT